MQGSQVSQVLVVAPVQALDVTGCHEEPELEQKQNKPAGP